MGLTGVIYGAIVVAWAAYLVPQALRRHDQASRKRSVERFSSAMRVLARRNTASSGRVVVTPPRDGDRLLTPSLTPSPPVADAADLRPTRAAMRAAAVRRRRVLYVLLLVTGITGGVGGLALIPWWSFAIPLGMVLAFLVIARWQVRRANEAFWRQAAEATPPEATTVIRRDAARIDASHGAARVADPDDEPTITLSAEERAAAAGELLEDRVVAVAVKTADGGSLWDPLPVTLPTYVDKPVAKRSIRTIELGEPGTWSSGHSEAASQTAASAKVDAEPGQGPETPEETVRVVNG